MNEGFYVSIRNGRKRALALGPYASEPQARQDLDRARRLAEQVDPWAGFYQVGTCKVTTSRPLPTGRLNHLAQRVPATSPPGPVAAHHHQHPAHVGGHTGHDRGQGRATPPRGPAPVTDPLYLIVLDGVVYDGYRDGRPFTLVDAMRQVYGTRGVTICRPGAGDVLVPVVTNAGSASEIVHAPTGRRIRRRPRRQRYADQPPPPPAARQAARVDSRPLAQAADVAAAARPATPGGHAPATASHAARVVPRPAAGSGGRVPPPPATWPGTPAPGR